MDNNFQHLVDEDLNDNSQEPAIKGDIRNLAIREELRFMAFDASIKDYIYKLGWKFFAATIGTIGVMFTFFGMFVTSSLK